MIVFQANDYEIDLSLYSLSLNEESNMFMDNMIKSYSFPFSMQLTPVLIQMLGLYNLDNITSLNSTIEGRLVVDGTYYEGTLTLGDRVGDTLEAQIYYGEEVLPVYDTKLSALPWPVYIVEDSPLLYVSYVNKTWPKVTHNFPMIYRPDIKKENDYEDFELFVNKTVGANFVQNVEETIMNEDDEEETFYRNKNVLSPCTYVLEILSFGFKSAGKKIRGTVLQDTRLNDLIYIPEQYLEKFKGSLYTNFQFDFPTSTKTVTIDRTTGINLGVFTETINVGEYVTSFTPDNVGTYNLKFNLNLDPVLASYFSIRIYQKHPLTFDETDLYNSHSEFNRVSINEDLNIDVTTDNQYHVIWVVLTLKYTNESIANLNSFEYSFKDGRLNELIGSYSLAEFMPDMTFGEWVNLIKNWLNLDITFNEDYVYINFVEDVVEDLPFVDHSHLEILKPKPHKNDDRTFRLNYSDESYALVDKTGQIFSDLEKNKKDIIEIDMGVQMAVVEQNYDIVTAVYPKGDAITFALYSGLHYYKNVCRPYIDDFTGRVDNVYALFWKQWLATRTNNITITDTFMAHQSEVFNLHTKIYKYNHILLPKTIRKKRKLQEYWEVEIEAESM